ncbi:MAG: hypothetical protein ABSC17_06050 [Thermacetogeniaceae bacterium]
MADKEKDSSGTGYQEIILEAVKGIRDKILLYGIAVIALFVSAGYFGIQVIKTLEWPVISIATLVLIAYFFNKGIPQARERLKKAAPDRQADEGKGNITGTVTISGGDIGANCKITGVVIEKEDRDAG